MPVLDNLTTLIRKARNAAETPAPGGALLNIEAMKSSKLNLPVKTTSEEEDVHNALFEAGLYLARQDAWGTLGDRIRTADAERALTPGGVPEAEILSEGARADAVTAATRAVNAGDELGASAIMNDMQLVLEETDGDHGVAYVVAMANIDIGWAWRGEGWRQDIPAAHRAAFFRHFKTASDLVDRFDAFELDSPMLAAVRCALLSAETRPRARASDDYEDLIDLAPGVGKYMRALGNHMLPRWFGSYQRLDHEARRTMERTEDVWGSGAYAWTYLDALTVDGEAYALLDADLFCQGLRDILARQTDQHTANVFAAYTGTVLEPEGVNVEARAQIADCFDWIVTDHLREVHPRVWYAAKGVWASRLDDQDRLTKGRHRAWAALDRHARGLPPVTAPASDALETG
ncbi:hypothetical protein [Marivita hallyeonensis]|uniref:Uncharacterized protein n=1 Tax=Marivita hallyeonensis TaxID=996342 RepID=A0A1M5W298_9RHOB|nr:hypothetical protein [Marivita hallyeonensis]SHH81550.1 hypothetical protein SAMN05443551_3207 [Marivita hallyeonensis]